MSHFQMCKCCKETTLRTRDVILTHCYDTDGNRLKGENGKMKATLREPNECRCYKCGDSTR